MRDGRPQGSLATGDRGQAAISLMPDIDGTGSGSLLPTLQADSLPAEPPGKPKSTGVEWEPIPFPADLPDPGIKPGSPTLQVDSLPTELSGKAV